MTGAFNRLGDRLLVAMLPKATAAACLPSEHYNECEGPKICGSGRTRTKYSCTTNCAGIATCYPIGCC